MSAKIDRSSWAQVSRLLDEALDLPPEERVRWLETLDAAHAMLRPRLERLLELASKNDTETFLNQLPPVDGMPDPVRTGTRDAIVGPYRLVRELGGGGMATVWLAERRDGLLTRPVALKLPHRAWRGARLSERMARERGILATLSHPNIATLYDAGIAADGQPFLSLEYVEGEPIDEYCLKRSLTLRARLALFLQVGNAVAHAHAKLVVHRDLKPSNILVTPAGDVRLLDFGIAKLLEGDTSRRSHLTEQSGHAMTPDYAAPEQILGEPLTVAADIYSLGVVLYELLTGQRPYRLSRDSRGALENAILEAQPARPSEVARDQDRRALRGDLDTIVLKALKKVPNERYATVHALTDDIVRYLRHRPVLAQPDNWRYLAGRFVARNKLAVGAALTVLVAILVGGAAALWQAREANAERQHAEQVQAFLTSVLQNADPYNTAAPPRSVEQWLVQASNAVERRTDFRPELRVEVLVTLGTGLLNSQNTSAAEEVLTRAVAQGEQQLGRDDPLTLHARVKYGTLLRFRGRTQLLRQQMDELLPKLRAHHERFPEDLVIALKDKTHLEIDDGHFVAAETAAREGFDVATRLLGTAHVDTVVAHVMLAWAVQHSRDPAYALEVTQQAYQRTLARYNHDPRHPRIIEVERLYGLALGNAGRMDEGLAHIRTAVDRAGEVFGADSRMAGLSTVSLARMELEHGELLEALTHARSAVDNVGAHADRNSYRYADALAVLGDALLANGRVEDAVRELRTATDIFDQTLGPTHPYTRDVAASLERAEALLRKARGS
jgi:serine/threonine protein kinase/tetratricopeptide (TPR) repeat protein